MTDETNDIETHRKYQQGLAELAVEIEPSNDLWPSIAARLSNQSGVASQQRLVNRAHRLIWGAAAMMLLSIGMFGLSLVQYNKAEYLMAALESQSSTVKESFIAHIDTMESNYQLARSSYLAQIDYASLDNEKLNARDLSSQLKDIEIAISQLKTAINKYPDNPNLPKLLKATYEQELLVLSQLAQLNQHVFREERI